MKISMTQRNSQRGAALFTVLIVMGVLAIAVAGMVYMSAQQPNLVKKNRDMLHARTVAEAGANVAYAMLCTNFALKDTPSAFPVTSYRGGTYDVSVSSISATSAVLTSMGTYNSATSSVAMDVVNVLSNSASGQPAPVGAYANTAVVGGSINWNGSGRLIVNGTQPVVVNNALNLGGTGDVIGNIASSAGITVTGSAKINGNATAPSITADASKITGTRTIAAVSPLAMPNIDLTPYYNVALANGRVYTGNYSINSSVTPPGGVIWVNGNLTVSGSGAINACLIATGDVTLAGNITHTKYLNYPSVVSQNGTIHVSGGGSWQGLFYAPVGTLDVVGNINITGTVILRETINKSGNGDLTISYQNSTPVAPGGTVVSTVGISGWRQ